MVGAQGRLLSLCPQEAEAVGLIYLTSPPAVIVGSSTLKCGLL